MSFPFHHSAKAPGESNGEEGSLEPEAVSLTSSSCSLSLSESQEILNSHHENDSVLSCSAPTSVSNPFQTLTSPRIMEQRLHEMIDPESSRIRSAYLSRVGIRSSLPSYVDLSGEPSLSKLPPLPEDSSISAYFDETSTNNTNNSCGRLLARSGPSTSPTSTSPHSSTNYHSPSRRRSHSSALENFGIDPNNNNKPNDPNANYLSLAQDLAGSDGYLPGATSSADPQAVARYGDSVEKERETELAKDQIFNQAMGSLLNILERRTDIDYSAIQFGRRLGQGAFGEVYHAQLWGIDVAAKKLKCDRYNFPLQEITSELAMLKALRHPNCVLFLGFVKSPFFCIITEYMPRGSLYDIIHNPQVRLNNQHIIKVAYSVGLAMSYLHSQQPAIVHKDLKSHNILVDDNWTIKVGDYGLSTIMDSIHRHQYWAGTAQWRAPEVTETTYSLAADVYSYGVVLWEMITRKRPFEGLSAAQALRLVKENHARPSIPRHCPPFFKELMEACWHTDPNQRPKFPKIVETLKKYESDAHFVHSAAAGAIEVFRASDITSSHAFFKAKQNSIDTILPEGVLYARCWTGVFHFGMRQAGLYMLNKEVLPVVQNVAAGNFVFVDEFGRAMVLFIYDSHEKVREADEIGLAQCHLPLELHSLCCTPLIRENLELVPLHLNLTGMKKGMVALVITVIMSGSYVDEAKTLYDTYVVPELQQIASWRGSLILTDFNHSKFKLVNLFTSKEQLAKLEADGFVHQQMANFSTFVTSTPTIEHYNVEEFHYMENDCNTFCSKDIPSKDTFYSMDPAPEKSPPVVTAPPADAELDKEWEIVLEIAKEEEEKESKMMKHQTPTGEPPTPISPIAPQPLHSLHQSTDGIATPMKDPLWAQVKKLGAFLNGHTLNENELSVFQRKFKLPAGEFVLRVVLCHHAKTGPGQLYITPNFLCFSAMLSFERNQLVLPIRDIISLNKTKYSLLPGAGHGLEIMTVDRLVHVFRGVFKRDQVVSEIAEQGRTMKPHRHLILVLYQGEPEEMNKPFSMVPSPERPRPHPHSITMTTTTTTTTTTTSLPSSSTRITAITSPFSRTVPSPKAKSSGSLNQQQQQQQQQQQVRTSAHPLSQSIPSPKRPQQGGREKEKSGGSGPGLSRYKGTGR